MSREEGVTAPSPEVEAILTRALGRAEEGEWDEAAEELREELSRRPDDPYLNCWLGMAERELGLEGVAYERFKRALAADPRDPVLLATAGNALAAFDDPAAEGALRTAALLAPRLPQARWMYGAYLAREGLLEDALGELDTALELDPDDPVIHTERGGTLAFLERLDEAGESFARAAELDQEDGWALALLALVRLESARRRGEEEDVPEVAHFLHDAAHLRPGELETQLLAALALAAAGEDGRAMEMLERARLQAEGVDLELVLEVEDQLESGPAASLRFLADTLGPSALRERLMQRP
jgi:tetratricopeptide (TPR) repeat protein